MKKIPFLFLVLFYLIFSSFQCGRECESEISDRSSYIADILPAKVTYNLGEEIVISSKFSSNIELVHSDMNYNNSDLKANFKLLLFKMLADNKAITVGSEFFDIDIKKGIHSEIISSYNDKIIESIEVSCNEDYCEFAIGFTPKKLGNYGFLLRASRFGNLNDDCEYLVFDNNRFNIEDNNFGVFENTDIKVFRLKDQNLIIDHPHEYSGIYFFEVKE